MPESVKINREELNFKVSTGLKRIIGRDLITNDLVAVFELVKNSFDAQATRVDLFFDEDNFFIIDNGKGMTHDDIINKWLFVAYSAKKDGTEDPDYRDKIAQKKAYAGSKGVGRFSCDRLGSFLKMQSRHKADNAPIEVLEVDWDLFEEDAKENFLNIPVDSYQGELFEIPFRRTKLSHGTSLHITGLRETWHRDKILSLKSALAKLINPFDGDNDKFAIHIHAPIEKERDNAIIDSHKNSDDTYNHNVVNGKVENFIFETLSSKTTRLDVAIVEDGETIESKLIDRGELIFHIKERNPYDRLKSSGFSCRLFYLNKSAKYTFSRRMGVNSVVFGSVFLFKNGFRAFPVGEEGDDSFHIDRRHQQGYARTLGTRDLVGRIDVRGNDEAFQESSSRDQGLIKTPAYEQLEDCFKETCLKRLERYVVGVAWKVPTDSVSDNISKLMGDKTRSRVIEMLTKLTNSDGVTLIDYSKNLIDVLNEKSDDFEKSIVGLRLVAEMTGNNAFLEKVTKAEKQYQELKKAEEEARIAAELERAAREAAEKKVRLAEAELTKTEMAYEEEKKRNLFLSSVSTLDYDTIVNLHHQIGIYAADINNIIANNFDRIRHKEKIKKEDLLALLEQLAFRNQKILSVSKFATKANFRLDSETISEDIVGFISEYIEKICTLYSGDGLDISVSATATLVKEFKPIELFMLIDNLVNNSTKSSATEVKFDLKQVSKNEIEIVVEDDGIGFDTNIKELNRIFEKGFTTTEGSGLGLYHVAYIVDQMNGAIEIDPSHEDGVKFIIRIRS
jgi:signal transduction histidine kinase